MMSTSSLSMSLSKYEVQVEWMLAQVSAALLDFLVLYVMVKSNRDGLLNCLIFEIEILSLLV